MRKNTRNAAGIFLVQLLLATLFAGCTFESNIEELREKLKSKTGDDVVSDDGDSALHPTAADFDISGLSQIADGSPKQVSITPKSGKSNGTITIHYGGTITAPSAVGTYSVTFDVAESPGWNAASGLSAGTLTISEQVADPVDPIADDFDISGTGTFVYDGLPKPVSVEPKEGKSGGLITVYYNDSRTAPSTVGTYALSFDITESLGFNAAEGLSAGTLTISAATPTAADFVIGNLSQMSSDITEVTITPKSGKSEGKISIYYNGETSLPTASGTYQVSFDVAADGNWNAAEGLGAGTLFIYPSFSSVDEFSTWLSTQPPNSPDTPYTVALNISDLGGNLITPGSLVLALYINETKYVSLDLSGSTMTNIPDLAFSFPFDFSCKSLTSVTIPNSVTTIGVMAFMNCVSLASVTITDSVTTIGGGAFYGCSSLASVTIPNSVTTIGDGAFVGCTSLVSIDVDTANTIYNSIDGVLYSKDKTAFIIYPAGKTDTSFTIPNSVTNIEFGTFYGCSNLASVTIPNSVINIGASAFSDCTSLASVTIPDRVTSIGNNTFSDCTSLASVTIGNSVTSIESSAFSGCSNLADITIPDSVTRIENNAFFGCSSLADITIPDSVTYIGYRAFSGCSSLTSVTIIPNSVILIYPSAFEGCSSLTNVTFEGTIFWDRFMEDLDFYVGSAFPGDLRAKFYETDPDNGTPGTYTTTAPVDGNSVWTRE